MSRDAIVMALATIHRRVSTRWDTDLFVTGAEGKRNFLFQIERFKETLRDLGPDRFTELVQRDLSESPDATGEILDMLFAEVLGDERKTWDEFAPLLREI